MGKKSGPPAPPDPTKTAQAQTQSNTTTAENNATLNNVNQVTPFGNVTYDVTGTGPNNIPRWTQTTTLSPEQQNLLNLQTQQSALLGQLGIDQTNRASDILGTNYTPAHLDVNAATGGPLDINSALGSFNGDVEAQTRELLNRGVGEAAARGQEALDSRLANQGLNAGSDAWGASQQAFTKGVSDAYAANELTARQQAAADRGQQLSEILSQRGTNLSDAQTQNQATNSEMLAARDNPLNEIIGLANGNQVNPINPGQPNTYSIAPTDVGGITNQGYQNQISAYNANLNAQNGFLNSLAGLGAAAITKYSDPRLKRDVSYSHTDANGLRWWRYRYLWDAATAPLRLGVMATEAPAQAVHVDPHSGFLMVDYGAL